MIDQVKGLQLDLRIAMENSQKLKAELDKHTGGSAVEGTAQSQIFKSLYQSLRKSKETLLIITEALGLFRADADENDEEISQEIQNILGYKRPRNE